MRSWVRGSGYVVRDYYLGSVVSHQELFVEVSLAVLQDSLEVDHVFPSLRVTRIIRVDLFFVFYPGDALDLLTEEIISNRDEWRSPRFRFNFSLQ